MSCQLSLAALNFETLFGLSEPALRISFDQTGGRCARIVRQEAHLRQIELWKQRIDKNAGDQHTKEQGENQTCEEDSSPESRPTLVIRIKENRNVTILAHIRPLLSTKP